MKFYQPVYQLARFLVLGFSVLSAPVSYAGNDKYDTERALYNKLKFLEWLAHDSPTQIRIKESNDESAKDLMEDAQGALIKAKQYYDNGKHEKADYHVDDGIREMTRASRLVKDIDRVNRARIKLYKQLREQIDGFIIAYDRILDEKEKEGEKYILDKVSLNALMEEAQTHADSDNYVLANHLIRRAADMVERSLSDLRHNDVLFHDLSFATVQDEYNYEVKRNRSYELLIELVKKKSISGGINPEYVNKLIVENKKIREKAERLADAGDFESGIRVMENGTDRLSRLLRMSGGLY